jgi:hypothetical protein
VLASCATISTLELAVAKTRHYSIEVKDTETNAVVVQAAADWTDDEKQLAVAHICQMIIASRRQASPDNAAKAYPPERLARWLVGELAIETQFRLDRAIMLASLAAKLGVPWKEAEAAAEFAAARAWIDYRMDTLRLGPAGRAMLEGALKKPGK